MSRIADTADLEHPRYRRSFCLALIEPAFTRLNELGLEAR